MIELTEQQRHELSAPEPVAIDPQTNETNVLVRKPVYERLKSLLAHDDCDPDEDARKTGVGIAFIAGSMGRRRRSRYYLPGLFPAARLGSTM